MRGWEEQSQIGYKKYTPNASWPYVVALGNLI